MSLPPPAANGTIMRIGLLGKPAAGSVCARDGWAANRVTTAPSAMRRDRRINVIIDSSGPRQRRQMAAPQALKGQSTSGPGIRIASIVTQPLEPAANEE